MAANTHVAVAATTESRTFDGWQVATTTTVEIDEEWQAPANPPPINQADWDAMEAAAAATRRVKAPSGPHKCKGTQPTPAWSKLLPGEPVSLDIEFQNFKHFSWEKYRHRIGWVAIVNSAGEVVLDCHAAYPKEDGVRKLMPPPEFGVTHKDLLFANGAVSAYKVERWVKQIIANRTVILHGGTHDLTAFVIEKDVYAKSKVVDTQRIYPYLQDDGTPGLRTTAEEILRISVQEMGHSPVEDAQTTLQLWKETNSYDREAEVAKLWAAQGKKAMGAKQHNRNKGGRQNHGRRNRIEVVAQEVTTQVVVQQAPPPDIMDGNEFPPLGAMVKKRRSSRRCRRQVM